MGFLSEIKKLLFVKKSIAKSAAEKTSEYGKEKASEFIDSAGNVIGDLSDKTTGLRDSVLDKAGDYKDKGFEKLSDIGESLSSNETIQNLGDTAEKIGDKVLNVGEDVYEKLENVGGDAFEKAKDLSETLGEKVMEGGSILADKAKEVGAEAKDKFDDLVEKAQIDAEIEKNTPKKEFADTPIDLEDSLLDDTDDFFSKAAKYADGDYSGKGKAEPEMKIEQLEAPKEQIRAAGFTDLDGDGDEIIDDAIIVED